LDEVDLQLATLTELTVEKRPDGAIRYAKR
ncbi:MAG TPA: phosphatase, partial [Enterobacteriaceae bacterium]|nr:phosphatase [Enterobacteriaceae bacterium]